MTYNSKNYVDVITEEDKYDPYVSETLSIGGFAVKNNLRGLEELCALLYNTVQERWEERSAPRKNSTVR